jgi:hypothetical protein
VAEWALAVPSNSKEAGSLHVTVGRLAAVMVKLFVSEPVKLESALVAVTV